MQQGTGIYLTLPVSVTNNFVYYDQRDTDSGGMGINHAYYSGYFTASLEYGSYWGNAHDKTIIPHRLANDEYADQVRIRIYKAEAEPFPWILFYPAFIRSAR